MDKIAVDETEKRIPLGNNSVLIVQNISSTPLEWSHEPRSTSVFQLYPGDMLKVNYDIWVRNSSHGDDYVVSHSFGATETVPDVVPAVTTAEPVVNPFFSSIGQHSNSFTLNFNHASKKSHKIACSSNGTEFTFEEGGLYKFVLYVRYINIDGAIKVGLVYVPPPSSVDAQPPTGMLYRIMSPDEILAYDIPISVTQAPSGTVLPTRHILEFKPVPVLAGTTIRLAVGSLGFTSDASVGFAGGASDFLSINKM